MASAFDGLEPEEAQGIKRELWEGQTCAQIARERELAPRLIRKCRDELFAPFTDPKHVKAVANGPIVNSHSLNRPRAARRRSTAPKPVQTEMFA